MVSEYISCFHNSTTYKLQLFPYGNNVLTLENILLSYISVISYLTPYKYEQPKTYGCLVSKWTLVQPE